jgi:exopolysaccharide biosynthesis polyprenyl glycosylphosphotransferase
MTTTSGAESAQLPIDILALDDRTRRIVERRLAGHRRRRGWLLRRALACADVAGLLTAFLVALLVFPEENGGRLDFGGEAALFALVLPFFVVLAKLHGLYDRDDERTDHSSVDDITRVFNVVTIGTWMFFLLANASGVLDPSITRLTAFWLLAIAVVPLYRVIARALCRRSVAFIQNTAIVGTGPVGRQIAHKIRSHPELGLNLIGFIDSAQSKGNGSVAGLPVLGSPQQLRQIIGALDLERVIVGFTDDGPESTLALVRGIRDLDVQIDIVPRLFEAVGTTSSVHMIEGMALVGLPPIRLSPSSRLLKRSFDVFGSALGLMVLFPLLVAVAVAIKLDSRGPVFFRQLRRGEREQTFWIYKFRTMVVDAEERKKDLTHLNMHADGDSRMFKIPNDPRLTRVGRFLRRTSLDELPQLINVLKGEMSLVGPRPLILEEDGHVTDWARKRLELRPGITGLWQVLGRSDIPFAEMTKLDYLYVTSWSLKEDVRLILLTIPSLLRQRKAF